MRSVGINALIMAGLLLGQVVSIRHSHGEYEPLGHAATPHLHLQWFASHSSHSHGDECDHDSSDDAADHNHTAPTNPAPADHDDGAVYRAELIAIVSADKTLVADGSSFGESAEFDLTFVPTVILTLAQAVPQPPLKTDLQEINVFLRTFSLRI